MTKVLCCMNCIDMKEVFDRRHELGIKCMMIDGRKIYNEDFPYGIWLERDASHLSFWLNYYNQYNVDYILVSAALDVLTLCQSIFYHNVYMVYPDVSRYEEIIEKELKGYQSFLGDGLYTREKAMANLWTKDQWIETIKMIESNVIVPLVKLHKGEFVIDLINKDMSQYDDYYVEWNSKNWDPEKTPHLPGNDGAYTCNVCGRGISSCENHIANKDIRICLDCSRKISKAYMDNFETTSNKYNYEMSRKGEHDNETNTENSNGNK